MPDATIAECLRVTPEFRSDEHDMARERLSPKLDARLSGFDASEVELELSCKDRDTPQQKVTLEAWISTKGSSHFVATSNESDLQAALGEVREDLHRQINKFLERRQDRRTR